MRARSVAVTGLGPVTSIGIGRDAFWRSLCSGASGTRSLTRVVPPARGCAVAAEVHELPGHAIDEMRPVPRAVELAAEAARLAWEDSGIESAALDRDRVGVVVGTGLGNLDLVEDLLERVRRDARISPLAAFRSFAHASATELASTFDLRGPMLTVTSGCNSGADALGVAIDWLRSGRADAVLVGGTEAELTRGFLEAMTAARALAVQHNASPESASRPFDVDRGGNVPGEGAAFLVLETWEHAAKRSARAWASFAGFSSRAAGRRPPYDPFNPPFDTAPLLRSMRGALEDAGLEPSVLSCIHANGSSSVFYDRLEARSIVELTGETRGGIPVTSLKGALGQTGAVTPALQAIAAVLSIHHGVIPPTANHQRAGDGIEVRVVVRPEELPLRHVMTHAIGFGGAYNASMVFSSESS